MTHVDSMVWNFSLAITFAIIIFFMVRDNAKVIDIIFANIFSIWYGILAVIDAWYVDKQQS